MSRLEIRYKKSRDIKPKVIHTVNYSVKRSGHQIDKFKRELAREKKSPDIYSTRMFTARETLYKSSPLNEEQTKVNSANLT